MLMHARILKTAPLVSLAFPPACGTDPGGPKKTEPIDHDEDGDGIRDTDEGREPYERVRAGALGAGSLPGRRGVSSRCRCSRI